MADTKDRTRAEPDPDRGVAVNSATDPTRPGTTPRPVADPSPPGTSAQETSVPKGGAPAPPSRADVERPGEGPAKDVERG